MKKLINPFVKMDRNGGYNCFGCSPFNELGLHLEFWEDGEVIFSKWKPRHNLEGWIGILHGGIQTTLMDEVGGWVVLVKLKTAGVTADMNVKFHKPLSVHKGEITIKGKVSSVEKRIAAIDCTIEDENGEIYSSAQLNYFIFPEKIARAKYYYPGVEAFYQ